MQEEINDDLLQCLSRKTDSLGKMAMHLLQTGDMTTLAIYGLAPLREAMSRISHKVFNIKKIAEEKGYQDILDIINKEFYFHPEYIILP